MMNNHILGRMAIVALFGAICALSGPVDAEPHGTPAKVIEIRMYSEGGGSPDVAFIFIANSGVCANASVFEIPVSSTSGQGLLSNALSALATGASVVVEVSNSTGCTNEDGGGPLIQSLSIIAPGVTNNPY